MKETKFLLNHYRQEFLPIRVNSLLAERYMYIHRVERLQVLAFSEDGLLRSFESRQGLLTQNIREDPICKFGLDFLRAAKR